tara:strand:- start:1750 stop:2505 length:756 start_codon:yes stop_codon:yes gene_type:complete
VLLLSAAGVALAAPALAAPRAGVSVGAEFRTGDYGLGGADIDDYYLPVTVDLSSDKLIFRATVPYARVEGPEGSVLVSDTVLPGQGPRITGSGIGDVIASLTVQDVFVNPNGDLAVDLTGTVKLGTADDDKGLGTGETDYSAQLDVYRFLDRVTLFATFGYKVRGEPPGIDLEDTWFMSFGGARHLSERTSVGASLGYRPEVVSSGDAASEAVVYVARQLSSRTRVSGHVMVGLAEASADWGLGVQVHWSL